MFTKHELDENLTIQDKVRVKLNERMAETGSAYVPVTVADLATDLGITRSYDVYQALSRLKRKGELELDKDGGTDIVGIKVIKLEPSGRTYQRAAERIKSQEPMKDDRLKGMTALNEYMHQKLAIFDMQERAKEAGLNPAETIKFEPNAYAEEGLLLLNLLNDAFKEIQKLKKEIEMMGYDLAAERRNVANLKREGGIVVPASASA